MSKGIEEILKNINADDLKRLVNSPVIQNVARSLSNSDKEKLIRELSAMDSGEIQRKLKSAGGSVLDGLTTEELTRRIKGL